MSLFTNVPQSIPLNLHSASNYLQLPSQILLHAPMTNKVQGKFNMAQVHHVCIDPPEVQALLV